MTPFPAVPTRSTRDPRPRKVPARRLLRAVPPGGANPLFVKAIRAFQAPFLTVPKAG
ncbi:MAG TPA: hypothetical protein VHE12_00505 [bacterium]|nr:hypothetical protein [bacterium]